MGAFRKRVYVAAGGTTVFMGSGRKEFNPKKLPPFTDYLLKTANNTLKQIENSRFDEGVIGSFMSGRFLKQANLPGFLPFMVPELVGKPCTAVEGACGTGGRCIGTALRGVLSDLSDSVFIAGFEMQNTMKSIYGADVLAGAAYYSKERKKGYAHFFPGIFAERAGAYLQHHPEAREIMAAWYEQAILNARKNPKAQEYQNTAGDLLSLGFTPPDPSRFIPHLNYYDCSKVSDGAASLVILSEEGLCQCGIPPQQTVEIVGLGEAEADITQPPEDLTVLSTTRVAVQKALDQAGISKEDIGLLEIHDCFTITALLALEAIGFSPSLILEGATRPNGSLPTNPSGGLIGFGHPTGATGVRQMVDLLHQFTGKAANPVNLRTPYGMMISMGGNDVTVTCCVVRSMG